MKERRKSERRPRARASWTVITPSFPTFFVASAMILPIALGQDRRNRALDVVEGMQSATRATSRPISSPAARRWWPRLEAAHILIHEKKLSSLQPLVPILEAAVQTAKPLLLVAEDIERRRHRSGGGAASLRAQAAVGKLKDDNPDIQAGINIVLRALEAPSHHTPRSTTSAASRNAGTDGCGPCCTRPPMSC